MVWPPIPRSSSASHDQRRRALGLDDVGGQEDLHLAGDLLVACSACWPRPCAASSLAAIFVSASARRSSVSSDVLLRGLHVARNAQLAGALGAVRGVQAQLVDLDCEIVPLTSPELEQLEERLRDLSLDSLTIVETSRL